MILALLYTASILLAVGVAITGLEYYLLPLEERPHSDFHESLKPGGTWGHGLGILGSSMLLLLFLYSARKREKFGLRFGSMKNWLSFHIFLGIMGPVFITLHTALKFGGIVSISYFSMMIVFLSGIFGRYVYMQIPRDAKGHAVKLEDMEAWDKSLTENLQKEFKLSSAALERIRKVSAYETTKRRSGLGALARTAGSDLGLRFRMYRLRSFIRRENPKLPASVLAEVMNVARDKMLLRRRIAMAESMSQIFHLWHVFHKPFAVIMVVIMFLHIAIAVSFGYKWVF